MRERNDGTSEDNIMQNKFTAYFVKAIVNRKVRYLHIKYRYLHMELPLDVFESESEAWHEPDLFANLTIMERFEDFRLQQALKRLKKRDLHILLARAIDDLSFSDIANDFGISVNTAASAYRRALQRLRKELAGGESK